jgi:hypothetical protein
MATRKFILSGLLGAALCLAVPLDALAQGKSGKSAFFFVAFRLAFLAGAAAPELLAHVYVVPRRRPLLLTFLAAIHRSSDCRTCVVVPPTASRT